MTRRNFLKTLTFSAVALPFLDLKALSSKNHNLILIELKGGNDGLNTLIPYSNPLYYKYRPNIGIPEHQVLKINQEVGLHPSLKYLKDLFDKKEVSIYQGVGYENPNRSHFRSIEIWDTESKSDEYLQEGWLKKHIPINSDSIKGVVLSGEYGPLSGFEDGVINIENINAFVKKSRLIKKNKSSLDYNKALTHILNTEEEIVDSAFILKERIKDSKPLSFPFEKNNFAKQMQIATQLINTDINIPFYKLSIGSFDTHINQLPSHARLLSQLSHAIYTMRENLIESNMWQNTTIMTYSEFGRRVQENANKGTDHGTAAPHFIIGGNISGGRLFGRYPELNKLDENGDLKYTFSMNDYYKAKKSFL